MTVSYRIWRFMAVAVLLTASVLGSAALAAPATAPAQTTAAPAQILGPFSDAPVYPYVWNGDLRDLPQSDSETREPRQFFNEQELLQPKTPGTLSANWRDGVTQDRPGNGQIPGPIISFPGMNFGANGNGWPPDTNGDVGPNHYMQTVNTSVGIYNKATGAAISTVSFNTFFQGPVGTPCDASNDGDPVVMYDAQVDRWIVTDFAWGTFSTGPYYECIAVSQTGDPVAGGWYFYALRADTGGFTGYLNDYPKLGVWSDGWYMTANMFQQNPPGPGYGVRAWAMDRASMITGGALNEVHFDCLTCGTLLASNIRGTLPPANSPNYMVDFAPPATMNVYEFDVDWVTPANSTFTGPASMAIEPFAIADQVPQQGTGTLLDTLSFRPMMQLQYRNYGTHEALFASHTIATNGRAAPRWYEVRSPGSSPTVFQQGTYQPDSLYRWMPSIAADKDGNIALGYSVSSSGMFPAIRYAGQLAGETPGVLAQGENTLHAGNGSQTGISRWGDYATMTVDPVDDCTFWFTTEYYAVTGSNWQTRIGSFKFPSCGVTKGTLSGQVTNAVTNQPIANVQVYADGGANQTFTTMTDGSGNYTMKIMPGTYNMTAGPQLPGYPTAATANSIGVTAGNTTVQNFQLQPAVYLAHASAGIDDSPGNSNGYIDPGESVLVYEGLVNAGGGGTTATSVAGNLSTGTVGVTVNTPGANYPNIAAGAVQTNTTPYVISVADNVVCGTVINFTNNITSGQGPFSDGFGLVVGQTLPRANVLSNDVEGGAAGWTTGGTANLWAITTESSHSPTHSWTDSPGAPYGNNVNSWVRSPAFDLSGKIGTEISLWVEYGLEPGYDFAYVEYSTNGGTSWAPTALAEFNGTSSWTQVTVAAPQLDGQANAAVRIRMTSDSGVVDQGIHWDDLAVSYQPYQCNAPTAVNVANLDAASNGTFGYVLAALALVALVALAAVTLNRGRLTA